MPKYQQSIPEEVQSEQREEKQVGRTLGWVLGFRKRISFG
jgi:hypothetical protein